MTLICPIRSFPVVMFDTTIKKLLKKLKKKKKKKRKKKKIK